MSVEQKIAELLAESEKLKTQEEVIVEDVENLEEDVLDEATPPKAQGTGQGAGDNPDNKKAMTGETTKPAVTTSKAKEPAPGAGAVKEEVAVDVSEDVAALVDGEELSEEFKTKAATIFEAAVVTRVKAELSKIQEEYDAKLVEEFEQIKEGLVEKVDGYLGYVVEQWMKQNEIALETGMRADLAESFINGMKAVFEEHYVDVPAEKYDVLGSLEEQVVELEDKLNESVEANIAMQKKIAEYDRATVVAELSEGLTATEEEKFQTLAAEIVFESVEQYQGKLQTIRESYFTKAAPVAKDTVVTEEVGAQKFISEDIAQYAAAISKYTK